TQAVELRQPRRAAVARESRGPGPGNRRQNLRRVHHPDAVEGHADPQVSLGIDVDSRGRRDLPFQRGASIAARRPRGGGNRTYLTVPDDVGDRPRIRGHVDLADAVVAGIRDVQVLLGGVERETTATVEPRIECRAVEEAGSPGPGKSRDGLRAIDRLGQAIDGARGDLAQAAAKRIRARQRVRVAEVEVARGIEDGSAHGSADVGVLRLKAVSRGGGRARAWESGARADSSDDLAGFASPDGTRQ